MTKQGEFYMSDIISYLFETNAIRFCEENKPFWYTSGKIGPYFINTHFVYGNEDDAMNGNEDGVVDGNEDGVVDGAVDGVVDSTVNGNEDGNEDGTVDGVVDGDQNSNRNVNVSNDRANDILNNTGNINYFDDTAMKKYKRGIALLDTKVKIVRGMWFKNMKDPNLRLICGVNCRNEITCIVPVGENEEEIMTFPVKKCMSVKGRLDIIKTVMKKAGFHTISDRESDDRYGE